MAFGIPTADQIDSTVQRAIQSAADKVGGIEKVTAADLQAEIAAAVSGLLTVEHQAAADIAPMLSQVVDVGNKLLAELALWRGMVSKGISVLWGSQL